ncbi:NBR1-Ig-like domain-containing protein [Actinomadura kijaniata]|uniref:NBR1-Ig-like domain-containing protein n=1 Tax=Actinomadura kijaniata TaxID=46161 RepID=UPI003F1D8DD8
MSGKSGAISHTTLHEATKGNRLPSWGATVEFVKACGADPEAYRERWERANLAVRSTGAEEQAVLAGTRSSGEIAVSATELRPVVLGPQAPVSEPSDEVADDAHRGRFRLALPVGATLATAAVGAVIISVLVLDRDSGRGPDASGPSPKAAGSPSACPVALQQPDPAPPARRGDAAKFVADVTLPDCTRVGGGKTVTKVWRIRNTGTVPWKGYSLLRLDLPQRADHCRTEPQVPIDDTRPGETVDIRIDVTTPKKPGLCYVRFKMMNDAGRVAFPGSRPVNFQIIVS